LGIVPKLLKISVGRLDKSLFFTLQSCALLFLTTEAQRTEKKFFCLPGDPVNSAFSGAGGGKQKASVRRRQSKNH